MMRARTALLAVLAMSVHAAAAGDTALVERGDTMFQKLCSACHGKGHGDDSEPATLLPGTLALRIKYRGERPALLENRTDLSPAVLRAFVRNGVGSMPPFRPTELSDRDIEAIAAFLTRSRE